METYLYEDLYRVEDNHWWHIAKRALVRETLSKYGSKKKSKKQSILDMGCGTGRNLEELKTTCHVYGVDISKEAIDFCKKRGLTQVYQADALKLPFNNKTFDYVLMLDVLEHVDERVLGEVKRVLKPGGVLLITVPAFSWLWSKWDEVLHHRCRYSKTQLTKVVEQYGFTFQKVSYLYSFLLVPIFVIRKIKTFLYRAKEQYPSDFTLSHPFINWIGVKFCALERWLFWKVGIPFGTSVVGIYRAL